MKTTVKEPFLRQFYVGIFSGTIVMFRFSFSNKKEEETKSERIYKKGKILIYEKMIRSTKVLYKIRS